MIDYTTTSKAVLSYHLQDDECFTPASGCYCAACLHKYAALPSYPLEISRDARSCSRDLYPMLEPPFDQDGHLPNPFLFCPTHVDAFSLQYRSWRLVEIKALTDSEKCLELMDSLVMDERSKILLDARIEESLSAHRAGTSMSGVTILLQGQSGTGKTSTASKHLTAWKNAIAMLTANRCDCRSQGNGHIHSFMARPVVQTLRRLH